MRRPKPMNPLRVNVLVEKLRYEQLRKLLPAGVSFSMVVRFFMDVFQGDKTFRLEVVRTLIKRGGGKFE